MRAYQIKICGITNEADAFAAAQAGADYLGYILNYPASPRFIAPTAASAIIQQIKSIYPRVQHVGVFVNATSITINQCVKTLPLDVVQLHGIEPVATLKALHHVTIWKTIELRSQADVDQIDEYLPLVDAIHLDAGKGSGQMIDARLLQHLPRSTPVVLAGGVTATTIQTLYQQYHPAVIDVNSGVEVVPGKKDTHKLFTIMQAAAYV